MKLCITCGIQPICLEGSTKKPLVRCRECHRKHKSARAVVYRKTRRVKLLADASKLPDDRRVCERCLRLKRLSEFSCNKNRGTESVKLNKTCDTCLTKMHAAPCRNIYGVDFSPAYWRRRAYGCNSAGRQHLAGTKGVKIKETSLDDLSYICKPQDLADLYNQQEGKCHYCKVALSPDKTSVDHATALCNGGPHALANFRLTCRDCNHLKHTRNEDDFFNFIQEYVNRFKVVERADKELLG